MPVTLDFAVYLGGYSVYTFTGLQQTRFKDALGTVSVFNRPQSVFTIVRVSLAAGGGRALLASAVLVNVSMATSTGVLAEMLRKLQSPLINAELMQSNGLSSCTEAHVVTPHAAPTPAATQSGLSETAIVAIVGGGVVLLLLSWQLQRFLLRRAELRAEADLKWLEAISPSEEAHAEKTRAQGLMREVQRQLNEAEARSPPLRSPPASPPVPRRLAP